MLCNNITVHIKQCFRCLLFSLRVIPAVSYFYIYFCIRINRIYSQCKCIYSTCYLRIIQPHSSNITYFICFSVKSGCYSAKISRLIYSSKIIIKVFTIAHISCSMRKIYIRIFFCHISRSLHISPASSKYYVTSCINAFLNRFSCCSLISIADIILSYNL